MADSINGVTIPFSIAGQATTSWLYRIAQSYVKAVQGDVAATKEITGNASATDAQWQAAHPDMGADVHKYDYARNAYKAAAAALASHGALQTGGAATAGQTIQHLLPFLVGAVLVYFLLKWVL